MRILIVGLTAAALLVGCTQENEPAGGSEMEQYEGTGRNTGEDTGGNGRVYDRGGAPVRVPDAQNESAPGTPATNAPGTSDAAAPAPSYPRGAQTVFNI